MSEWTSRPLNELATFQKGRKVQTSESREDGFLPYLGASAISGVIDEYADPRFGVTNSKSNAVLMLWDGERSGLVGIAPKGVISSTVALLTPKAEFEGAFLYFALANKFEWIQNRRTGTGVPHVPKDLGRILSISYPAERCEQRRISEILFAIDAAIEQTEALIAKLEKVKAGMMHDLFIRGVTPDGRLRPSRAEAPDLYKQSPLGWIPAEWNAMTLSAYTRADITYGIVQAGPHVDGGVPYIRTGDMAGEALERNTMLCTSPKIADSYARSKVNAGEIVCAIRATVGKVLVVPTDLDGANLTQGTARIAPHAQTDATFLLWCLRSSRAQRSIRLCIKGTTFNEITLRDLRELPIAAPTAIEEQQKIGFMLNECAARIECERTHLDKIVRIKTGLMADLLTGRVRVPEKAAA